MKVNSIKLLKNQRIYNKKGDILKFISSKNKYFHKFGEIYFSEIKKDKVKGWNIHNLSQCILTVPYGKVIFSFFDSRSQDKKIKKITISKKNSYTIIVPAKIWFNFKSLAKLSIVANILDKPHNKKETKKLNSINNIKIK